jgi:predicted ABC-type sugar transport system permease subunit
MSTAITQQREPSGAPADLSSRRLTERVFRARESGIIAVLVVFVAVTTIIEPRFLSQQNIHFVLINTTIFALLAVGETMVVVSRNVDLSVGSVLGLSAFLSARLFGEVHGIAIPVVFLVGLGIGLACARSAPTPKVPGWPASASAGGSSPHSRPAERSPVSPGCCGPRSTRPSTPRPEPAMS